MSSQRHLLIVVTSRTSRMRSRNEETCLVVARNGDTALLCSSIELYEGQQLAANSNVDVSLYIIIVVRRTPKLHTGQQPANSSKRTARRATVRTATTNATGNTPAWFVDLNHPVPSTCELQQRHGAEQHGMLHSLSLSLSLHRPPVGSQKHAWTERGCMISGGQLSQPNGGVRGDVIWY